MPCVNLTSCLVCTGLILRRTSSRGTRLCEWHWPVSRYTSPAACNHSDKRRQIYITCMPAGPLVQQQCIVAASMLLTHAFATSTPCLCYFHHMLLLLTTLAYTELFICAVLSMSKTSTLLTYSLNQYSLVLRQGLRVNVTPFYCRLVLRGRPHLLTSSQTRRMRTMSLTLRLPC